MQIISMTCPLMEDGNEFGINESFRPDANLKMPYAKYVDVENEFISVIVDICEQFNFYLFKCSKYSVLYNSSLITPNAIGGIVGIRDLDLFVRMSLRDEVHFRMYVDNDFYITTTSGMGIFVGLNGKYNIDIPEGRFLIIRDASDRAVDAEFHYFGPSMPQQTLP